MCDCIKTVTEGIEASMPEAVSVMLPIEMLSGRLYLEVIKVVMVKGKRKEVKVPLLLSRCPFCGELKEES